MEQAQAIDNTELSIVSELQLRSITELTCLAREPGCSRCRVRFSGGGLAAKANSTCCDHNGRGMPVKS
jgi:hypothetical protein